METLTLKIDTSEYQKFLDELKFLRYFYDRAYDAMGPAVDEVYEIIKEEYVDEGNALPEGYGW